ncbi:MAG: NAD(+) synthase, partial [Acidaminococcaceae bacterium]
DKVFSAQVRSCGIPLLYCNNIGIQNNGKNVFTYDGCSCIYDVNGHLVANSNRFEPDLLLCEFDTATGKVTSSSEPKAALSETEEIYAALYYGAKKFLAQMHIAKMTIGISGGIDSAVTAAFYINVLGPENVLLVNMPSRYNSQITKNLAQTMAKALGTNYTIMPIQNFVDQTIEQITTTPIYNYTQNSDFYLKLTSLAKENIQARDRGARIIAGLSSAWGGAFSCNSNKTELTVGYATFYGDIAGCLALIGDLWKHQVYALGRYLNEEVYKRPVIAEDVFKITPSAELSSAQTVGTGGDPLLYPYHDYLFKAFVEKWHKVSPEEILLWYKENTLEANLGCQPGLIEQLFATPAAFIDDLEHWWELFCGFAVAKRIQAPPILSITKRSYGYDHRESQLLPYFSQKYLALKKELLQ